MRLARCPSRLWIEVCDTAMWRALAGTEDNGVTEGGRGFWLVEALSERFGVHGASAGPCVWALIRREPSTGL
ncbi:ATP-binding protein [Streptomyces sp. NPDC127178]|uniref:ATP-binding protein n=1 Tax=unclassified Streptomyces TaxID=2593676 RepID=UPI003626D5D1